MLFGFPVVPYTTPNAASVPNRTNTWSPPPRAVVGPVSSTSWPLIRLPPRAIGLAVIAARAVAMRRNTMKIVFAFTKDQASFERHALSWPRLNLSSPLSIPISTENGWEEPVNECLLGRPVRHGAAKVLRIHSVRTRDEDTDPRSHRPESVGSRVRRVGDRRERPREFIRTDGGRGVDRSVAACRRPRSEFHRHGRRLRLGPQRGSHRRSARRPSGRCALGHEGRRRLLPRRCPDELRPPVHRARPPAGFYTSPDGPCRRPPAAQSTR